MVHAPSDVSNAEHYTWGDACDGWHLLRDPTLSVIRERVPPSAGEVKHYHARVEAERESIKLKVVEYVSRHVGDVFEGVVTGVTKFGVFVEMTKLLAEGLVHVRDMDDDHYEYDERNFSLVGTHTRRTIRLGDPVKVQVAKATVETRKIDLVFAE